MAGLEVASEIARLAISTSSLALEACSDRRWTKFATPSSAASLPLLCA